MKKTKRSKIKYTALTSLAVILVFTSFFVYRNIQESSYQKKYQEFYDIEEYILSLDDEDDLCDSLRYNDDGSESQYKKLIGRELEHEGFIYNSISGFTLEHELYNIRYGWHSTTEDKMFNRGQRELKLVFFLEDKETLVESRNIMRYDFKTYTQIDEVWYGYTNSSTVTEFDEERKEIYEMILKDMTERLDKCE